MQCWPLQPWPPPTAITAQDGSTRYASQGQDQARVPQEKAAQHAKNVSDLWERIFHATP